MAQDLTFGLNLFEFGDSIVGSTDPSDFSTQGFSKKTGETGFFLNTDRDFNLWIHYSNGGWIEYASVDVSDEAFGTGISIAWLSHETHGEAQAAYFQTTYNDHEFRVFSRTRRLTTDVLPGDSIIIKNTLIHSPAHIQLDADNRVTGKSAITEFNVDTTTSPAGSIFTFTNPGDFWYGLVLRNDGDKISSDIIYDPVNDLTTVTFNLPNSHDNSHDSYTIHLSLKENVPAVPKYVLTANTYVVNENGEFTVTLSTQNVAPGVIIPWTITGVSVADFDQGDFTDMNALTGQFVVGTTDSVSFTMLEDSLTEGVENILLTCDNGEGSVGIAVNDTSVAAAPTYVLSKNNNIINEGDSVTITLTTTNVTDGTQLPYSISGIGIDVNDFNGLSSLNGALTVNGNSASITLTTLADQTSEGDETFVFSLNNGLASTSVAILDTSIDPAITQGIKMAVVVGDDNYGDGSLQYRLGGRGNYTEINWGDGVTDSFNNNDGVQQGYDSIEHTYPSPGTYIVEVKGSGVINPFAPHYTNTKWKRDGMPLYDATADTGNVGPFGMNRPAIELDFSTVTGLSVSGSTMTITDNANTDWASIVTGAIYSDAIGGAMQMSANNERFWSEITSAVTTGNTTTITIASGGFYAEDVGDLEEAIVADGVVTVINDLITYPIQMVLRPDPSQHPNFQVKNINYVLGRGMWDLDRNLPVVAHNLKLTQITHWGTEFTHSLVSSAGTKFMHCKNMDITATDSPDFTSQGNLYSLFFKCDSLTDSNNTLNTNTFVGPHTTGIGQLFYGCISYNNDLTNWETENITNFQAVFRDADSFNGDVTNWRLDSATNLTETFWHADSFNRDINTNVRTDGNLAWHTANVTSFHGILAFTSFNQSLDKWNTYGNGSEVQMQEMFRNSPFNQDLITKEVTVGGNTYIAWDTSKTYDFSLMFYESNDFNGDITNWDTSNSKTFKSMFFGATVFNQPIDTHSVTIQGAGTYDAWDVKNSLGTSYSNKFQSMFYTASSFNQDLNNWDVTDGSDMLSMFFKAFTFNGNISNWDVSNLINGNSMFDYAHSFNQDISGWTTTSLTNMSYMFRFAWSFDQDLNGWDVSNVSNFYSCFRNTRIATGITGNWNFNDWNVSGATTMEMMFYQYSAATNKDLTTYGGGVITTAHSQWHPIVTNWDVSNVTSMSRMFHSFTNLLGIDLSNWNCDSVTNLYEAFQSATTFDGGGLHNSSFPVLSNMGSTFLGTNLADVDMSNYGSSGNLTNISNCFRSIGTQVNPSPFTGLGLENWNVSGCTSLSHTFIGSSNQFNGDISGWDVSNVTNMTKVLHSCSNFTRDLSGWNTQNVTSFLYAFNGSSIQFDPSSWDISSANNMTMSFGSGAATTWDQARVDSVMAAWGSQNVQNDVTLNIDVPTGVGVPTSGAGLTGYNNLVNNYNWSISIS